MSILFVGIAYHFLLRDLWAPEGLQLLADLLLHYGVPVLFLLNWMRAIPKVSLRWVDPVIWSGNLAAYLISALVRGTMLDTYTYPFIRSSMAARSGIRR